MRRLAKLLVALLVGIGIVAGVTACSGAPSKIDMSNVTSVIDVRTPSEYAAGHLKGAVNIDVQSSSFATQIAKLDKNGTYVIYCKSGNRAGQAITQMQSMGFKNLTNAGGYADASKSTGLPIVQ